MDMIMTELFWNYFGGGGAGGGGGGGSEGPEMTK